LIQTNKTVFPTTASLQEEVDEKKSVLIWVIWDSQYL